jgi:PAS domain S-box-containing protein
MIEDTGPRRKGVSLYYQIIIGALIFGVLALVGHYNYLLFHGIAEIFSSVVAFSIFVLAWHSRRFTENDFLLFLGIAFLFIGILDLVHMLAYSGMGVFTGYGTDLATQLWIVARYIQAFSLLAAVFFLTRKLRAGLEFAVYTVVVTVALLSIFYWRIFPACFVEGVGLTPFKKISEYIISAIFLITIVLFFKKRGEFDPRVFKLIVASIALIIASELCFTLYTGPYAFFNFLGHFLKIVSFYLIYRAIVETGLEEPYELLFRKLKGKEERERAILNATDQSLILYTSKGTVLAINETAARRFGYKADDLIGSSLEDLVPEDEYERMEQAAGKVISDGRSVHFEETRQDEYLDISYYPVFNAEGNVEMLAYFARDITERKKVEKALVESREEWRRSFNAIDEAMLIIDEDFRIRQHNRAFCELLGEEGDYVGRRCYELVHTTDKPPESCVCMEAIEKREGVKRDLYEPSLGKHLSAYISPLFDAHGNMEFGIHVIQDISERKQAEGDLRRYSYELEKRVKELNCLYSISRVVEELDATLEDILVRAADILPPAWLYPEIACARITLDGEEHASAGFKPARWRQASDILVNGNKAGTVEVFYLEERPDEYEGPFLEEERELIDAVAERLGRVIERVHTREALRESEEKYRLIVDNAQEGIWAIDREGNTTFVNRRMASILGYTQEEMTGRPIFEFMDEEARKHAEINLERRRQGIKEQYDFEFLHVDGSRISASLETSPILDDKGEIIGALALVADITERKRMEEAMRESEEKFRSVVEQSSDGIVLVDVSGVIIEWNSAQENIVGLKRDDALGRFLWDTQFDLALPEQKTPDAYEQLKTSIMESLDADHLSWTGETSEKEIRSPGGERRTIQSVTFPIRSSDGLMMGSITRDITQRVNMERALEREVETNKVVAELAAMLLSQASIDEVSYAVLENARRLTESDFGYVGYIDTLTGYLVSPTLTRDIWESCRVAGKEVVFKEFTGLWGWVLKNRKPLVTNSPSEDTRSSGVPEGHIPIHRLLSVPALVGDTLVGQISLANPGRDYTSSDLSLVERLADLYSVAVLRMWSEGELEKYREQLEELVRERTLELEKTNRKLQAEIAERRRKEDELRASAERLRALSARLESVREEERRHIAREVHDTLGQALTGLKINLSLLGKRVAGEEELEGRIEAMSSLIDSTIQSVREISTELRPGILDDLGLAAALDWQLKRFGEMTGLESDFVTDMEDSHLDKDLTVALFRITQEALTNIARHAGASRVNVRLSREQGDIVLEIRDDGRGITVTDIGDSKTLGILGMRERAHVLGGRIDIRGDSNSGTTLRVSVPIRQPGAGDGGEDGR